MRPTNQLFFGVNKIGSVVLQFFKFSVDPHMQIISPGCNRGALTLNSWVNFSGKSGFTLVTLASKTSLKGRVKNTFAGSDAGFHASTTEIVLALITDKSIDLFSSPSKIWEPSLSF